MSSVRLTLAASLAASACARARPDSDEPQAAVAFGDRADQRAVREAIDPSPPPAWHELVTCEADDDCVVVEMGCCEGEWTVSIAAAARDEAERRWARECPRGRRCFDPVVHGWVEAAVCEHRTCARIEEQLLVQTDGSWSTGLVFVSTSEPPWSTPARPDEASMQAQR
jgi:hypothetical protein